MSPGKQERVVAARMKLMTRYKSRMAGTPAQSDDEPRGSGPANRHGMPRVPVGQYITKGWPTLDLGVHPAVDTERWRLRIDGAVARPVELAWADLMALEQTDDVSDFHCVTTWTKLDMPWRGVRASAIVALAEPLESAEFAVIHAFDDYTTNLPLEELLKDDVLVAHTFDGKPLSRGHGGPARLVTPQLYAWKAAKWISRIELTTEDRPGYWEVRGYSNTAHPWRDDRYS